MSALTGRWAPPLERTKTAVFTHAGSTIGIVTGMALSGYLCTLSLDNGWPLVFYVEGAMTLLWLIGWNMLVFDSPAKHPRISKEEKRYIESAIGHSPQERSQKLPTPWRAMLTSLPLWAIVGGYTATSWVEYTLLTGLPLYMADVLKFTFTQNGLFSALPFICMFVTMIGSGQVADILRARNILSTRAVRALFQGSGLLVPAAIILTMGYLSCHQRTVAVVLLCIMVAALGLDFAGYWANLVDIAPRFAGVTTGISSTVATISGILAPTIIGGLTPNGTLEEWRRVFFIFSGVCAFGAAFFVIFCSGEEQSWAKPNVPSEVNRRPSNQQGEPSINVQEQRVTVILKTTRL